MKANSVTYEALDKLYALWLTNGHKMPWLNKLAKLPQAFKDGFVLYVRNDLLNRELEYGMVDKFAHIYLLSLLRVAQDVDMLHLNTVYKSYRTLKVQGDFGIWFKDSMKLIEEHE